MSIYVVKFIGFEFSLLYGRSFNVKYDSSESFTIIGKRSYSESIGLTCLKVAVDSEVSSSCTVIISCNKIAKIIVKLSIYVEAVIRGVERPIATNSRFNLEVLVREQRNSKIHNKTTVYTVHFAIAEDYGVIVATVCSNGNEGDRYVVSTLCITASISSCDNCALAECECANVIKREYLDIGENYLRILQLIILVEPDAYEVCELNVITRPVTYNVVFTVAVLISKILHYYVTACAVDVINSAA